MASRVRVARGRGARKAAFELTKQAADRLRSLLATAPKGTKAVRLGVKSQGCNGLAYTLDFAQEQAKFDEVVEDQGLQVYIDPKALMYVVGTKMDWEDKKLESGFVFESPLAVSTCGCGESFTVSDTPPRE